MLIGLLKPKVVTYMWHQPGWPVVVEFLEYLEFFWSWKVAFLGFFWNFFLIQDFSQSTFWVTTFSVCPYLDLLFVIIHYFISAQSDFNNRPSQQVNCRPSQEPDVILKTDIFVGCPFIRCYHYWSISCFWEWKRTGAEIVPFVVMWLLLRVCNQCYMYFMSLLCYFSYFCLLLQSIWLIRSTSYLNSMKMTFGCL